MSRSLEERLSDSEQRYRLLADNLVDVIWVINTDDMAYEYVSPSVEALLGYTGEEVRGSHLRESLTRDSYHHVMELFNIHLQRHRRGLAPTTVKLEAEMLRKGGGTVWTEVATRFFKDDDGPLRLIGITRDITERRNLELQRETLIEELREALAERDKLLRENRVLRGLLPICAQCKRIRDEQGHWRDLERFVAERTEAKFTHTICPDCRETLYPEIKARTPKEPNK